MAKNQKTLPLPAKTANSSIDLTAKREMLAKAAILYSKELSPEIVELWDGLLAGYSADECSYAFDYHMRNGKYFPKPSEILDAIRTYRETNAMLKAPKRYKNQGEGYGENDVQIMWKLFKMREYKERMSDEQVDDLINELDQRTGRA